MKSGVNLTGKMSENSKAPSSIIKEAEFVKETRSAIMNIFQKQNLFLNHLQKIGLSYVFTMNAFSTAENCMKK